jgi:hypothetical protein
VPKGLDAASLLNLGKDSFCGRLIERLSAIVASEPSAPAPIRFREVDVVRAMSAGDLVRPRDEVPAMLSEGKFAHLICSNCPYLARPDKPFAERRRHVVASLQTRLAAANEASGIRAIG